MAVQTASRPPLKGQQQKGMGRHPQFNRRISNAVQVAEAQPPLVETEARRSRAIERGNVVKDEVLNLKYLKSEAAPLPAPWTSAGLAPDLEEDAKALLELINISDSGLWAAAAKATELHLVFVERSAGKGAAKTNWGEFCSNYLHRDYKTINRWETAYKFAVRNQQALPDPEAFAKADFSALPPINCVQLLGAQPTDTADQIAYFDEVFKDLFGGQLSEKDLRIAVNGEVNEEGEVVGGWPDKEKKAANPNKRDGSAKNWTDAKNQMHAFCSKYNAEQAAPIAEIRWKLEIVPVKVDAVTAATFAAKKRIKAQVDQPKPVIK
jgi:hypothetical protein